MSVFLSALAGAGQQFFDNNGVPLAGGKLYAYLSGTTTPQATYTSVTGSVPHPNPIVLNAAGRVPSGEIWLSTGINYKFILTTSVDVQIATWDNITGINGTGISTNAAYVAYDPSGTGAIQRTAASKFAEFVSVKDFGAVGNGSTDDSAAIQAAVDASSTVYFPAGNYKINTPITLSANNHIWTHEAILTGNVGATNLIITADNTVVDGFSIYAAAPGSTLGIRLTGTDVVVKNCSFYSVTYCIHLYPCKSVLIDNNYFYNIGYGIINQSAVNYVFDGIVISNNRGLDCQNDMILFNTNSESYAGLTANNVTVIGNVYTKSTAPTTTATESRFCGFVHGTNITVTGNVIYGTRGDAAMHYEGAAIGDVDDSVTITNNAFRDCISDYARFIWLINGSGYRHVVMSGNTFEVTSATSSAGSSAFIKWGDTVTSAAHTVSDNLFRYRRNSGDTTTCYGIGIVDDFADQTIISNNQFLNLDTAISNGGTSVNTNTQILGNQIKNCVYGINSNSAAYSFDGIIANNVFEATGTNDIFLSRISSPIVTGNIFSSVAKSINDKTLVLLQNCRDNQTANFGRQQILADLDKATAYPLGYVGQGANTLLINGTAEWDLNAANNYNSLVAIVGRGGETASATVSALAAKQNGTNITGITYTLVSGVLYANVAASAGVNAAEIQLTVDIA